MRDVRFEKVVKLMILISACWLGLTLDEMKKAREKSNVSSQRRICCTFYYLAILTAWKMKPYTNFTEHNFKQ